MAWRHFFSSLLVLFGSLGVESGLLVKQANADNPFSGSVFIDTYSAASRDGTVNGTRPYSTQAVKDGDYHLNLGSGGFAYDDGDFVAKFTGQYGTSVDVNYKAEPHDAFKFIQEGYVGAHLDENTAIEAGVFLSHIGGESWLSKDNLTYTRSFVAEFSPYYESGMRLIHAFSEALSAQILYVNGWQNISDNRHPALGMLLSYQFEKWSVVANNFIGSEDYGTRIFHDVSISRVVKDGFSVEGAFDYGYQSRQSTASGSWWGASVMAKQCVHESISVVGRVESYQDPQDIIVASVTGQDFQAYSSSLGVDIDIGWGFTLRNELKAFWSPNKIFLDGATPRDKDLLFVASLSFSGEKTL